jgi:hypothetical protein
MYITNSYVIRVIEKITEEGTFIKDKRAVRKEEEAIEVYEEFLKKYPDLKIECFNYKTGEMINKNF